MLFICLHQQILYKGSCSDRPSCTCRMVSPSWLLIVMLRSSLPSAKRFWELQQPHVIFFVCLPTRTYTCMMWKLFTKNFIKKFHYRIYRKVYFMRFTNTPVFHSKSWWFIQNHHSEWWMNTYRNMYSENSFRIMIEWWPQSSFKICPKYKWITL